MKLNFSKYKRFFAFGCSFTSYIWPTWANILHKEMPNATLYNLGRAGSGNLMISCRISEANKRFKFNSDDLVMVLYTTFTREDRWMEGSWKPQGNIFSQRFYSEDWVKKFADPIGYLIRDMAIIDITNNFLQSLPCDNFSMAACPFDFGEFIKPDTDSNFYEDVKNLYFESYSKMNPTLLGYFNNKFEVHVYEHELLKETRRDSHPSPLRHYEFLTSLNLPLTDASKKYAVQAHIDFKKTKTFKEILSTFSDVDQNITDSYKNLL